MIVFKWRSLAVPDEAHVPRGEYFVSHDIPDEINSARKASSIPDNPGPVTQPNIFFAGFVMVYLSDPSSPRIARETPSSTK